MSAAEDADPLEEDLVATRAWDGSLVRRLLSEARAHTRLLAGSALVLVALFVLELAGPWILRQAIDGPVAQALALRGTAAAPTDLTPYLRVLAWWGLAYLACALGSMAFRYLEVAHLTRTGQAIIADLRTKVFAHLQELDLAYFDKKPTGSLVTRVTTDIENLSEMYTSGLVMLTFDVAKIAAVLALLFALHGQLALIVLLLLPVLVAVSLAFRGGARDAHRAVRARLARLNGYLQEALSGVRVVQAFRREERVSKRFAGLLDTYLAANLRTIFLFALFFPALDLAVQAIQSAAVWVGGLSILDGELTYGLFVQFWFYLALLLDPVREMGERYNVLQSALASAERVFQVLDTQATVAPPAAPRPADPARLAGRVRFEDVSFSYIPEVEVLSNVSFEIERDQTVAVVGATGAGKSTLVNLLLRFYDPSSGRITIDGVDVREYDLSELRRAFGLVLQEDFLFAGSVHENLVMDREEVTDESLELALVASRAELVIQGLPEGLHAPVAERGVTFSTGQRQLLAIARALAGQPRIVILDEATSSVDSGTEAEIEDATRNLLAGRSALVIAHRLSTVRRADKILVMHRGKLREQGTHDQLLALGGIYARLHALQFSVNGA